MTIFENIQLWLSNINIVFVILMVLSIIIFILTYDNFIGLISIVVIIISGIVLFFCGPYKTYIDIYDKYKTEFVTISEYDIIKKDDKYYNIVGYDIENDNKNLQIEFYIDNNGEEKVTMKYGEHFDYYNIKDFEIEDAKLLYKNVTIIEDGQNKLIKKELKTNIKDFDKKFENFRRIYVYEIHI